MALHPIAMVMHHPSWDLFHFLKKWLKYLINVLYGYNFKLSGYFNWVK